MTKTPFRPLLLNSNLPDITKPFKPSKSFKHTLICNHRQAFPYELREHGSYLDELDALGLLLSAPHARQRFQRHFEACTATAAAAAAAATTGAARHSSGSSIGSGAGALMLGGTPLLRSDDRLPATAQPAQRLQQPPPRRCLLYPSPSPRD